MPNFRAKRRKSRSRGASLLVCFFCGAHSSKKDDPWPMILLSQRRLNYISWRVFSINDRFLATTYIEFARPLCPVHVTMNKNALLELLMNRKTTRNLHKMWEQLFVSGVAASAETVYRWWSPDFFISIFSLWVATLRFSISLMGRLDLPPIIRSYSRSRVECMVFGCLQGSRVRDLNSRSTNQMMLKSETINRDREYWVEKGVMFDS